MKCSRPSCSRSVDRQGLCHSHYRVSGKRGYVPVQPVRARLLELHASGMSWYNIADELGMTAHGLYWIRDTNTYVQAETARRVMALKPRPGTGMVDSTGTRRRVQALAVMGWPQRVIAEAAGMSDRRLSQILRQDMVTGVTAERVKAVFNELELEQGPSQWVRSTAKNRGWQPPLAWECIDDPSEVPSVAGREWVPFMERLAELEYLNVPRSQMPSWMGIQEESFLRQLQRHGLREAS